MNSSTSSFKDRATLAPARSWQAFTRLFPAAAAVLLTAFVAIAVLLDPYDTGRTPLALREGVNPQGPRTAAASRGRDPAFSGAIFGNSHIQLVSPERLRAATGIPFVSLIAPGSGPREALVLMDWFLRHHQGRIDAIVIGIDDVWCSADPTLKATAPFPDWLYARDLRDYLVGLVRFDVFEELRRRIGFLLAREPERARPDGYWDYESNYGALGAAMTPAARARLEEPGSAVARNLTGRYPALDRLEARLAQADAGIRLILVRPPVYASTLPAPGSEWAGAEVACREAFAGLAKRRPHSALIDWRTDRAETRDPNQFFDRGHYRQPIARLIETDIAAALAALR